MRRTIMLSHVTAVACAAGIAGTLLVGSAGASLFRIEPVMLNDQPVPGIPGADWVRIAAPVMDADGRVWFRADFTGSIGGFGGKASLWSGTPSGIAPTVRRGDGAHEPGPPPIDTTVWNIPGYATMGGGRAATVANLSMPAGSPRPSETGIVINDLNGHQVVARTGGVVPGASAGATFSDFEGFAHAGANGRLLFHGEYTNNDGGDTRGLWRWDSGHTEMVVREGRAIPGSPDRELTALPADAHRRIDAAGGLAFEAHLDSSDRRTLLVGTPGDLAPLAEPGDAAPGTPSGVEFDAVHWTGEYSGDGNALIWGRLSGPGVTPSNRAGLWIGNREGKRLLARTDHQVAGQPSDLRWTSLVGQGYSTPALGDNGLAAFVGTTRDDAGTSELSLWAGTPDELGRIASIGQQAPGLPAGIEFANFSEIAINARGHIAFNATLDQPANTLWAADTDGFLRLIARPGDVFEVAPGDFREVSMIPMLRLNSAHTTLSDNGELSFKLHFTDGTTGIFHTIIPAPGTLGVLVLAGLAAIRRRRG